MYVACTRAKDRLVLLGNSRISSKTALEKILTALPGKSKVIKEVK